MATFVTLLKFTEKGVKEYKDTCRRAADFKAMAKKHGIEVKETYWSMGSFDGVIIFDAPDDATAASGMLALSAHDCVTPQTLRCFTSTEMAQIVAKAT